MSEFFYTCGNKGLTFKQRQFYEDNGFIVIKKLVPDILLDQMTDRFVNFCNKKEEVSIVTVVKDSFLKSQGKTGENVINKIQDFLHDDVFFNYSVNKALVDIVESIIGPNITGFHSMLINKPPNSKPNASIHPLHQDLYFFPIRPAKKIVGAWTAMETVDEENGCLYVVPGTHKGILYNHDYPTGYHQRALYQGITGVNHSPQLNLIMEKGDTVFFHPLLHHGSGPNLSNRFRKAISCHYADTNCFFIDMKKMPHNTTVKELEELIEKTTHAYMNVVDFFKAKSRLIRGLPGRFQGVESHL